MGASNFLYDRPRNARMSRTNSFGTQTYPSVPSLTPTSVADRWAGNCNGCPATGAYRQLSSMPNVNAERTLGHRQDPMASSSDFGSAGLYLVRGNVLHDQQRGTPVNDETDDYSAVKKSSSPRITVSAQDDQVHPFFIRQLMQRRRHMSTHQDISAYR